MPESAIGNSGGREPNLPLAVPAARTQETREARHDTVRDVVREVELPVAPPSASTGSRPELESSSTAGLISELVSQAGVLARKEIELAKRELHEDLRREAVAAGQLGIAGVAAIVTLNLLLVTGVLALARVMPGWAAGLAVSGATLIVTLAMGISGWKRIKRPPLERTRRTLKDDAQWAKESLT